jgi:ribonuclease P protein component
MENSPENKIYDTRFTFQKEERLRSKKLFDRLFAEGKSFLVYPLKVVFVEPNPDRMFPSQAAFAVSKKLFKRAVKRNLLKRRMREAYRLNKPAFYLRLGDKKVAVIFIYIGKEILSYQKIESAMKKALNKISEKLLDT